MVKKKLLKIPVFYKLLKKENIKTSNLGQSFHLETSILQLLEVTKIKLIYVTAELVPDIENVSLYF